MTQIPFDQFAKEFLQDLLTPLGVVERSFEVPGEPKYVDVWFQPAMPPVNLSNPPTLLERIATTACLFEPFRNPPTRHEIRRCVMKLLWIQDYEHRKDETLADEQLPVLWVLASSVSEPILQDGKAEVKDDWIPGIYFCGNLFKTVLVSINHLPETKETLWLRVLGRDATQERAINEVLALSPNDPQRSRILQMLASWKVRIDMIQPLDDPEDEKLLMPLSQVFLDWERKTQEQAERKVVEALLKARFGELDEQLAAIAPKLLALPPEEYSQLLLQLGERSRQELLDQFS
jgi:hypothetical protein